MSSFDSNLTQFEKILSPNHALFFIYLFSLKKGIGKGYRIEGLYLGPKMFDQTKSLLKGL